jgi:hypothetical protein
MASKATGTKVPSPDDQVDSLFGGKTQSQSQAAVPPPPPSATAPAATGGTTSSTGPKATASPVLQRTFLGAGGLGLDDNRTSLLSSGFGGKTLTGL